MTPEGRVKSLVNKSIQSLTGRFPGKIWRFMPVQRGMGKPALDYILCANGRFVTIETKRDEKHDLTPQQKLIAAEIKKARGYVFVVHGPGSCMVMEQALLQLLTNPDGFDTWYWANDDQHISQQAE